MGTNWPRFTGWAVGAVALAMMAASLPAGGSFRDDDGNVHEAYIEALAAAEITKGCNPPVNDRFCPDQDVTREQLAAFLVRGLGLVDTGSVGFVDVDGSVFEADIERLAAAGITKGCNPPRNDRFCPSDPVTRDQLASFLGRALGLSPIVVAPYGGEIVVGSDQEPPTLNPFAPGGDNAIVREVGNAYFGGVYDIDGETLELVPDLVTELPTVANGGVTLNGDGTMTVVYDIDPDAVWSDGVPVGGEDFAFTLDLILDPDVSIDRTTYEDAVSTTVLPKRFEITLANPTPAYELMFPILVPEHAVAGSDFGADWNDTMWPSSGPFVFHSWSKGDQIRVVRNDRYWKVDPTSGRNLPFLDSVVFEFIPESSDLTLALRSGAVDVIEPDLVAVDELVATSGVSVDWAPGRVWEHINFQFDPARLDRNPGSVNQHLAFRKAVAHAIDRPAVARESYGGWAVAIDSYVDTGTPAFSIDGWLQYDYDVAEAQGYVIATKTHFGLDAVPMVFSTTANNDARVRLSELMVDFMEDAGIDEFENQLEDSQIFFGETLDRGLWDVGSWAWRGSPGYSGSVEILEVFDPDAPPPDGGNYYRWGTPGSSLIDDSSARFAEIVDELEGEADQRVVLPLLQEAEQILADNVIIIPLYARPVFLAWWPDEVGGMAATGHYFTWNIAEWYRVDL